MNRQELIQLLVRVNHGSRVTLDGQQQSWTFIKLDGEWQQSIGSGSFVASGSAEIVTLMEREGALMHVEDLDIGDAKLTIAR